MDMLKTASILYGVWTHSFQQMDNISALRELIKDWKPAIFWVYCAIIILILQIGKYSIPDNSNIHVEFHKIHVVHIILSGTENKA